MVDKVKIEDLSPEHQEMARNVLKAIGQAMQADKTKGPGKIVSYTDKEGNTVQGVWYYSDGLINNKVPVYVDGAKMLVAHTKLQHIGFVD